MERQNCVGKIDTTPFCEYLTEFCNDCYEYLRYIWWFIFSSEEHVQFGEYDSDSDNEENIDKTELLQLYPFLARYQEQDWDLVRENWMKMRINRLAKKMPGYTGIESDPDSFII